MTAPTAQWRVACPASKEQNPRGRCFPDPDKRVDMENADGSLTRHLTCAGCGRTWTEGVPAAARIAVLKRNWEHARAKEARYDELCAALWRWQERAHAAEAELERIKGGAPETGDEL